MSLLKFLGYLHKLLRQSLYRHHLMPASVTSKKFLLRSALPVDFSRGEVYDLQEIYQDLNRRLFKNALNLRIGWFGRTRSGRACKVVLGSFHEEEQLIRIHKSLDRKEIPRFFMEYLVYHEMAHSVVPREYSLSGRTIFHGKKFKEYEQRFPLYERAVAWEKAHIKVLLRGK